MTSDRIDALEIALAHAEATITDLSDTCAEQWREIDAMKKEIGKLTRTLEAMAAGDEGEDPKARMLPPHY